MISIPKRRVFISYHHGNDQKYKEKLLLNNQNTFLNVSVRDGDIDDNLSDQSIREKIRDDFLRRSSVTIVLVGSETRNRKHVDWEIYSSMYNGNVSKKSGILIINLPTIDGSPISISSEDKSILDPYNSISWSPIKSYDRYSYLPKRLLDNIKNPKVKINMVNYINIINNPNGLRKLIDIAYNNRSSNEYYLGDPMRRSNS